MTPKTRLSPSDSSASTPPSRSPLMTASSKKMSKIPRASPRSDSEIRLANTVTRQELGGAAGGVDTARLEQVRAVDHPEHLLHVLLDDQHGQAAGPDAIDQLEDLFDENRRQPGGRPAQQEQLRLRHQRPADRAHLLFAARHAAGELMASLAHPREQLVDDLELTAELRARGRHEAAHLQIVLDGHAREEAPAFRQVGASR